ncbi:MAG: hypothetical protein IKZ95_07345 [Lachnospiraceae bacterium]|nr:hypothetical protein [Lachnospiraceae bacterium]
MNKLISFRNKIESIYLKHSRVLGCIGRMLITFACLMILRRSINFNAVLSNIWVVAGMSIVCGFIPLRFLMAVILAYIVAQVFTLSTALGIVFLIVLALMYLLFFRYAPTYGPALVLLPIMFLIRLQALIPIILALVGPAISVIVIIFGSILYFLIMFLDVNAATFASSTGTLEFTKVELLVEGVFRNKEYLLIMAVLFVVFMLVHFLKRINYNYSVEIAIAIGTGAYIVLSLGVELALHSLTTQRLLTFVIGGLVSGALALLINGIWNPLDYSRTETVEFEDDEYNYYVKAVPKATFEKERVQVKRINKRKIL